jgi:hypothetical protein
VTLAINRRVRPAVMTWHEAARAAFKKDGHWLRRHIPPDFPRPHPSYGLFETEAVEKWINQRPPTLSPQQAGLCAFRKGSNWLRTSAPADFPRPDPTTGRFETAAVEAWVRRTYQQRVGRPSGGIKRHRASLVADASE